VADQIGGKKGLTQAVVEVDETYQNAGQKGEVVLYRAPRCRARGGRGRGTYVTDRPPIVALVGRDPHRRLCCHMAVLPDLQKAALRPLLAAQLPAGAAVCTDEYDIYQYLGRHCQHYRVDHARRRWVVHRDGLLAHTNTAEGLWSLVHGWLLPHRGVHKKNLGLYVCLAQFNLNHRELTALQRFGLTVQAALDTHLTAAQLRERLPEDYLQHPR
jgi:transposase-like protein